MSSRVRLLQESLRPAAVTEAWRELRSEDFSSLRGLTRLDLDHVQEESEAIALCLRATLEEPGKTAALVTPDRALAARVGAAMKRWGILVDDSAGAPLANLPVGSFLREVLAAAAPDASAVEALSLLKHPLAACGVAPAECRRHARAVERAVWRGVQRVGGWTGTAAALREHDSALSAWVENLAALFAPLTNTWHEKTPLAERLRQHAALAETLATSSFSLWHGEAGEAAALWFAEAQQAARDFPPLTGPEYARLFTGLLRNVSVRSTYGQHPRLAILGPLEARLHHADVMILGGLNEGVWPPEPPVDPWLSRPMKHAFGLPLPERRIGLSAHDFMQLASAPHVLLTRARRVGTSPAVPSRFLMQLDAVLQAIGQPDALVPAEPWQAWARRLDEPDVLVPCSPPSPRPPVAARPTTLSVTDIGAWRQNPYGLYAKRILRLKKLEDIDADVTASERGDIIHKALELFLRRHPNTLPDKALEELLELGREVFAPYKDRPQVLAFWWPRFERIAAWFLATEEQRRREGYRVLAVEIEGQMDFARGAFHLKGRADRFDYGRDGGLAIIDYKTGYVPSLKAVQSGYEPQLPLLALMVEAGAFVFGPQEVRELAYWKLTGKDDAAKTLKAEPAALMAEAREGLEKLIATFADPATPYEAVPKPAMAPRYDDYAHLARLKEWGRFEGEA